MSKPDGAEAVSKVVGGRKPGTPKTGGRKKGTPNKITQDFRETVRLLLEDNTENVSIWLAKVAEDNPAKALDLLTGLAEYAAPKLARTELTGENGGPIQTKSTLDVSGLTDEQLRALAAIRLNAE